MTKLIKYILYNRHDSLAGNAAMTKTNLSPPRDYRSVEETDHQYVAKQIAWLSWETSLER